MGHVVQKLPVINKSTSNKSLIPRPHCLHVELYMSPQCGWNVLHVARSFIQQANFSYTTLGRVVLKRLQR